MISIVSRRLKLPDMSDILERDNALQTTIPISFDAQTTERRTRGVNVSSSYLDILSRKAREEREKEIQTESKDLQQQPEVRACARDRLRIVYPTMERTHNSRDHKLPRTLASCHNVCK
jgi:hypothetical protein